MFLSVKDFNECKLFLKTPSMTGFAATGAADFAFEDADPEARGDDALRDTTGRAFC